MKTEPCSRTLIQSLEHRQWRSFVRSDANNGLTACSSLIRTPDCRPATESSRLENSLRPTVPTLPVRLRSIELPCGGRRLSPTPLLPKA